MIHTYIINSIGARIDIGRAQFLMDSAVRDAIPPCASDQEFWDRYCAAHREKHGAPFAPDLKKGF